MTRKGGFIGCFDEGAPNECWEWQGPTLRGYGRAYLAELGSVGAHRASYTYYVGPIPAGMTIDHICFNPPCVNPAHLRLMSPVDNSRRQRAATKTHCKNGHEFTPENTYVVTSPDRAGRRHCRECNRQSALRYKRRVRAPKTDAPTGAMTTRRTR